MPQNVYDKASRFAARIDPPGFFGWLLGLRADAFTFRGWLDTRGVPFPGDPDRTGDTVARLDNPTEHGLPWAVAVEFQSRPDPEMFGRLMGYLSGLWAGVRPDDERGSRFHVAAAVVNLTGTGLTSREMTWPAAGLVTQLRVVERNLEREVAEDLLAAIESGGYSRCMLPWVPLLAGGDDPDLVDRWKALAAAEPDPRRRANYAVIARIFAEKAGRLDLWQAKLEGWAVEESSVVNEFIALGESRGEARGRVLSLRASVLRIGTKRFGRGPTDAQRVAIEAINDPDRLNRLEERALDVNSWEELLPQE